MLRGEGMRGGRESASPARRVEAGMGAFIPDLRVISSHRVQNPFLIRGTFCVETPRGTCSSGAQSEWLLGLGSGKGLQMPFM